MLKTATLGFPRIGENRELKKAVEAHWKGAKSEADLQKDASEIRNKNWNTQKSNEISYVPSNDFSFYDQVLDTLALFGAVPDRYNFKGGNVDLELYFSMARGAQKEGVDVTAMEMTKWFDTNYHYIVGEFKKDQKFAISSTKIFDQYKEAKEAGTETRPVIIGPVTFLLAGKTVDGSEKLDLLDNLLVAYKELVAKLNEAGVKDVQIDEPCLVTDLDEAAKKAYEKAFKVINEAKGDIKDPSPIAEGIKRIEWADSDIPLLRAVRERFEVFNSFRLQYGLINKSSTVITRRAISDCRQSSAAFCNAFMESSQSFGYDAALAHAFIGCGLNKAIA